MWRTMEGELLDELYQRVRVTKEEKEEEEEESPGGPPAEEGLNDS
jgi:hypothetical protein